MVADRPERIDLTTGRSRPGPDRRVGAERTIALDGRSEAGRLADRADRSAPAGAHGAERPCGEFVESMRDGAATLSPDGLILYANRRLAELLARPPEEIVGSPLGRFVLGDLAGLVEAQRGGPGATLDVDLLDGRGRTVPVLLGIAPLDADGQDLTCVTFTDTSSHRALDRGIALLHGDQVQRLDRLQNAQAALERQASHDSLTGLPNRSLLMDRLEQALLRAARTGGSLGVFFVDLDRFKQVNDTRGHAAGDLVLQRTAERLTSAMRSMDSVARIGGDEFVVIAPDIDDHLHAVDIGNRLVTEVSRATKEADPAEQVTASVGISVSVGGRGTAETLLHEADMAMYQAKSFGGGRTEVFDVALARKALERSRAQRTVQDALDDRRVVVYYQPVVDLSGGHVAGFEALVRIHEADGSVVPPGRFIPVAEDTGLVVPLGALVLEMACQEAVRWTPDEVTGPLTVAVNLSARQFAPGNLPSIVRHTLEASGLDPSRLHLELTETAILDLRPGLVAQLEQLRDLGVEIGLDDFGTGYASLTHLRRLPLTFVKIDQTFVAGLDTDEHDAQIVTAVVDLAANLGLRSIGEGVERPQQLDALRELDCDQAQGYLFARPLPPVQLSATTQLPGWRVATTPRHSPRPPA